MYAVLKHILKIHVNVLGKKTNCYAVLKHILKIHVNVLGKKTNCYARPAKSGPIRFLAPFSVRYGKCITRMVTNEKQRKTEPIKVG